MHHIKKLVTIILVGLLIISGVVVVNVSSTASITTNPELQLDTRIKESMSKAMSWLQGSQAEDGSWGGGDLGLTALITLALINGGYDEEEPMVANAIDYLKEYVQLDGSITAAPTYSNYYTSVSILALASTTNPEYENTIENAVQFLMESQIKATTPESSEEWVGGFGYGGGKHSGRPDISNTQFALMALHAADTNYDDIAVPDVVWTSAAGFISRCQNLVEMNSWAATVKSSSYNDGGFVYYPGFSKAGEDQSYGSSTSAGVWCLFLCGIDSDDIRITSGLKWLREHYTWELNPNLDEKGLFNYYWGAARAHTFSRRSVVIDMDGEYHNWYDELANTLIELQTQDGYWVNEKSDWFWENIPELATAYTMLALETQTLFAVEKGSNSEMAVTFELDSEGSDLHLYDKRGGHIGVDYNNNALENTITQGTAKYSSTPQRQQIGLSDAEAGGYYVSVIGQDTYSYNLKISSSRDSQPLSEVCYSGELSKGENQGTGVIITAVERPLNIFTSAPRSVPIMKLNTDKLIVETGRTITYTLQLEEVGGVENINDVTLSQSKGTDSEITFDRNNFDIEPGNTKVVTCTVDVPSKVDQDTYDEYILIESSNGPVVRLQLELKDKKADSVDFSDFTIPIIGFIALTVVGLIFLVKRRKKE